MVDFRGILLTPHVIEKGLHPGTSNRQDRGSTEKTFQELDKKQREVIPHTVVVEKNIAPFALLHSRFRKGVITY